MLAATGSSASQPAVDVRDCTLVHAAVGRAVALEMMSLDPEVGRWAASVHAVVVVACQDSGATLRVSSREGACSLSSHLEPDELEGPGVVRRVALSAAELLSACHDDRPSPTVRDANVDPHAAGDSDAVALHTRPAEPSEPAFSLHAFGTAVLGGDFTRIGGRVSLHRRVTERVHAMVDVMVSTDDARVSFGGVRAIDTSAGAYLLYRSRDGSLPGSGYVAAGLGWRVGVFSLASQPEDPAAMENRDSRVVTGPAGSTRVSWPVASMHLCVALDAGFIITPTRATLRGMPEATQGRSWFSVSGGMGVDF